MKLIPLFESVEYGNFAMVVDNGDDTVTRTTKYQVYTQKDRPDVEALLLWFNSLKSKDNLCNIIDAKVEYNGPQDWKVTMILEKLYPMNWGILGVAPTVFERYGTVRSALHYCRKMRGVRPLDYDDDGIWENPTAAQQKFYDDIWNASEQLIDGFDLIYGEDAIADLNPLNIMVDHHGNHKLIDYWHMNTMLPREISKIS